MKTLRVAWRLSAVTCSGYIVRDYYAKKPTLGDIGARLENDDIAGTAINSIDLQVVPIIVDENGCVIGKVFEPSESHEIAYALLDDIEAIE